MSSGEEIEREAATATRPVPTFAEAARACHKAIKGGWANKRHSDSWLTSLETHIIPAIGSAPVDQVTSVMVRDALAPIWLTIPETRSEEHTSELQSLMRISYAVFCLKKKKQKKKTTI